jgi:hypothetical protein
MTKILIDEAVVRQALEALDELTDTEQTYGALDRGDKAITALRQALSDSVEQPAPAQEPYGWKVDGYIDLFHCEHEAKAAAKEINSFAFPLYTTPPAPAKKD